MQNKNRSFNNFQYNPSQLIMNNPISVIFFLPLMVLCLLAGCDQSRRVEYVAGTVMYNDSPLADAQISFSPQSPDGFTAVGSTNADGTFTLITPGAKKTGAVCGKYNVLVFKTIAVDENGKALLPETRPEAKPFDMAGSEKSIPIPKTQSVIPTKYGLSDAPLLQATVVKGKNMFRFELSDH
jgi:hypothetical protein